MTIDTPSPRPWIRPFAFANWESTLIRLLFALVMWQVFPDGLSYKDQPAPVGLAHFFDLTFLANGDVFVWLRYGFLAALVVYVSGYGMRFALPVLASLLAVAGALNNSQGAITHHFQIVALIALAQCMWYCRALRLGAPLAILGLWLLGEGAPLWGQCATILVAIIGGALFWRLIAHRWCPGEATMTRGERHRLGTWIGVQAIVAIYVVCGLSKVIKSGLLGWVADSRYFPLQVIKTARSDYFNTLEQAAVPGQMPDGLIAKASHLLDVLPHYAEQVMLQWPLVAAVMLGAGLILELGAVLALLSRGWSAVIGLLLVLFHLSVSEVMNLNFTENIWVLWIFLVQPHYWIYRLVKGKGQPEKVVANTTVQRRSIAAVLRAQKPSLVATAPAIALGALLLVAGENYPFSNFPMYSSFSDSVTYVCISDSEGEPIPIWKITYIRTGRLKKVYSSHLKDIRSAMKKRDPESFKGYRFMSEDERRPAAEATLEWLVQSCHKHHRRALYAHRPLRFTEVEISLVDNQIRERKFQFSEADPG